MSDVLVNVENVSKKFCRSLKRSLWYGVKDIAGDLLGRGAAEGAMLRNGEFLAVNDVSLQLRRGECLGLIGVNGAGKSTLLKMLNGLIKPDHGRIEIRGRIGALIELGAGFHPVLTGRENIYVNAAILGFTRHEVNRQMDRIIDFAEIGDALDAPVRTYSSGMRVRLGFAVASVLEADVLLIDEVLAVGDTAFRLKCFNRVKQLLKNGVACVLVSHDVNNLSRVCTRGVVVDKGVKLYDGTLAKAVATYESMRYVPAPPEEEFEVGINEPMVRISSVTTCNSAGAVTDSFTGNESIVLQAQYGATQDLDDSTIVVRIGSVRSGDLSSFTNHVRGVRIPLRAGGGSFAVRIPRIPFLAGSYFVRLAIYNADQTMLFDSAEVACTFKVSAPAPDPWREFYTLRLDHEWISAC